MTKSNNHPTLLVKSNGGRAPGCLLFDLLQPLNVNEHHFFIMSIDVVQVDYVHLVVNLQITFVQHSLGSHNEKNR